MDYLGSEIFAFCEEESSRMRTAILLISVLIFAFALGFFQEKIKISVNYLIEQGAAISDYDTLSASERQLLVEERRIDAPFDYYHNHTTVAFFYRFNQGELARMKWLITAVSLVLFAFVNIVILSIIQSKYSITRFVLWTYAILVVIAFGIYAFGSLIDVKAEAYAFSRKVIGALQSIVPSMIIGPAIRLWNSTLTHTTE
ncbi:MAG: hypothetical protein ACKO7B_09455 [Flavobacteriales bacterium]